MRACPRAGEPSPQSPLIQYSPELMKYGQLEGQTVLVDFSSMTEILA